MQSIHTMEYYLSIKRNEVLTHATTWVNLENIMLSDILYDSVYIKCTE